MQSDMCARFAAFVAIGFDHVIANMFLIPYGMKLGSGVTTRDYIARSVVPVWLGNTISAVFFVAGSYAFCYGTSPFIKTFAQF